MAHEVRFEIPERKLGKSDVRFHVKKSGAALGMLEVSKGAVVWYPKGRKIPRKIGWANFDILMQRYGRTGSERRS